MPDLNDQHKDSINLESQLFIGDPKKVLVNVETKGEGGKILNWLKLTEEEEAPAEDPAEEEEGAEKKEDNMSDHTEEEEIKIPPKNLSGIFLKIPCVLTIFKSWIDWLIRCSQ